MSQKPFFVTIPHSGEKIPDQTPWLNKLPEVTLMRDVDRFVDLLYAEVIDELKISCVKTNWHRYAVDLNRLPEDIDQSSVCNAPNKYGYERGFHWSVTTFNEKLISEPMSQQTHLELKQLIYDPFHQSIRETYSYLRSTSSYKTIYHLDLHSMPSLGTKMHLDPGETRADIVISDCDQKSCHSSFRDLVVAAYVIAGFKVAYNWPYKGGRVSQQYGKPEIGQQAIQIEMSRKLYMDEVSKKINPDVKLIQKKLTSAVKYIHKNLPLA